MILVDTSVWIDHLRQGEHLMAVVYLNDTARLWSRDKRLSAVASAMRVAYEAP
jgi:predicted nucleic acid-binding protein